MSHSNREPQAGARPSWKSSPVLLMVRGMLSGVALVVVFESIVRPWVARQGVDSPLVFPLALFVLTGLLNKWVLWRGIPTSARLEPMTPAQFAGVGDDEAALRASQARSPLPEVAPLQGAKGKLPLDLAALEARSRELEELGFVQEAQGRFLTNIASQPASFVRFFSHPSGAWAEVYQAFRAGAGGTPVHLAMQTAFEDGWSLTDGTFGGGWPLWALRLPRALSTRHEPGTPAREVWRSHLEVRAEIERALGVRAVPEPLDEHLQRGVRAMTQGRKLMLRRSLAWSFLSARWRGRQWRGDLARAARSQPQHSTAA